MNFLFYSMFFLKYIDNKNKYILKKNRMSLKIKMKYIVIIIYKSGKSGNSLSISKKYLGILCVYYILCIYVLLFIFCI